MIPLYEIMSQEDVSKIHRASLDIIGRTGIKIEHDGALQRLAEVGAGVDFKNHVARFGGDMVEKTLARVPKTFTCGGRTVEFDFECSAQRRLPILRSSAGCINRFDVLTRAVRPLTRRDGIESAYLADALDEVDILGTMTLCDIPQPTYDIHAFKDALYHCRKHAWALTLNSRNLKYQLEMMLAVAGSRENLARRPLASGIFSIISPMFIPHDEIERLLLYGRYRIPVRMTVIPIKGVSSPYTIAGTVAMINAQFLGALVVQQTLCPGLPTWYYAGIKSMDLRTTWSISNATPENMLVAGAVLQMARRYDLPSELSIFSFPGCQMEQYMFYMGAAVQWAMMSGLTGLASAGNFDGGNVWCPEAVVLADETLRYCKRMAAGFELDDGTLGVDAVQRVGHRGEFLSDPHTLIHLRKEKPFESRLLDWSSYEHWQQAGFQTLTDRAHARVEEIVAHHVVPELQPETRRELDQIAKAADRALL